MLNILLGKNKLPQNNATELRYLFNQLTQVNAFESWARNFEKRDFPKQTRILEEAYQKDKNLDLLIPKAFALTREAARRVLGERMFDVQILGGIILHQGRIAEMKTGEGKTLTSTSAAYLNSLSGNPVHMVTVNDYLAKRDAEWMSPVFTYLGKNVGYIISNMESSTRHSMYSQDIVYATNNELGFDYLRDNLRLEKQAIVQRGYHFCIIDEIDSVLIDEARTPLIISGPSFDDTQKYKQSNTIVPYLKECSKDDNTLLYPDDEELLDGDYKRDEKSKNISFTKKGMDNMERLLQQQHYINGSIEEMENFEFVHYVTQSLRAHTLFYIDIDYIINEGKVEIIDEFTGRVLSGRRYSDGLHQAIEAKEGIRIARQNKTLASVTFQNFFRMYQKLSGMTGTAVTEEKEFIKIYGLDVVEIATNMPLVRDDKNDEVYVNEQAKAEAIVKEIKEVHEKGQPLLLGTASIESSEKLSTLLKKNRIPHKVLNAKHHENEASIIAEAGKKGAVTIATNMAGRGTDIKLGGNLDVKIASKITDEHTEEEKIKIREEAFAIWYEDYREVLALGGLYVLGTERHESRRIDNQLRGRSGRQGDSGVSKFFLSLDDQLLKLFGQGLARMKSLMMKALDASEPLSHPLISRTMEKAQKNVEARNFEVRKHLLNFDEVLNEQKNTIYKQREEILLSDTLIERLILNITDLIQQINKKYNNNVHEIILYLKDTFHYTPNLEIYTHAQDIITHIEKDLHHKESLVGAPLFNEIIRVEYMRSIDQLWQDHISQLEELRQAVYLRSYAQKNPLLEYKLESYKMFDEIIQHIATNILRKFLALKAENIQIQHQPTTSSSLTTQHNDFSLLSPQIQQRNSSQKSNALNRPPLNPYNSNSPMMPSKKKVGRNDPCPCESGKKYKKCCGR